MAEIHFQPEDLFPECSLENCERGSDPHTHILPHQQEIYDWIVGNNEYGDFNEINKSYLFLQGGVGSAKSVAVAAACVALLFKIPCNRGIVGRRDFPLLYRTIWRDIKLTLKRCVLKGIIAEPKYSNKRQGDYTQILINENDSELYALQTKNWSEALGAGYGFFLIDDAMESQEELFVGDETSAGLISRLRPFARVHGNNVPLRFRGIAVTNPPPIGHWLHKLFGKQKGLFKLGNDPVKVMIVETFLNPFVGENYATGLMAIQQKMGRNADTARRVIFGESVPAYGGVKVFPNFDKQKHIGEWEYDKGLPLICGVDFGFHHPAAVFSNLFRCEFGQNHCRSLSEVSDCLSVDVWTFWRQVKIHRKLNYPDAIVWNGGDKAGYRASSSNKDKRGDMKIIIHDFGEEFRWKHLDLKNSLQYVRGLLGKKCKCGEEIIQIDKKCEVLIGALEGGYKYSKSRDGNVSEKPYEDRWFADVACAWRYGIENFVKWGIPRTYTEKPAVEPIRDHNPWDWMNLSDEEFSKRVLQN